MYLLQAAYWKAIAHPHPFPRSAAFQVAGDPAKPGFVVQNLQSIGSAVRFHERQQMLAQLDLSGPLLAGALALVMNQRSKDTTLPWEDRSAARGQAEALAVVADVSLGVGIAGTVASVIALVVQRRTAGAQQVELLLVPAGPVAGPGLTLSGRFGRAGGSK